MTKPAPPADDTPSGLALDRQSALGRRLPSALTTTLAKALDWVQSTAAEAGADHSNQLRLRLIAEELCANAIMHASIPDGTLGEASIVVQSLREQFVLRYEWPGAAVDPLRYVDGTATSERVAQLEVGRIGLLLACRMATFARYQRLPDLNVLEFVLSKISDRATAT